MGRVEAQSTEYLELDEQNTRLRQPTLADTKNRAMQIKGRGLRQTAPSQLWSLCHRMVNTYAEAEMHITRHKSVQTTEIYIKGLLAEILRPNERPIIASVK